MGNIFVRKAKSTSEILEELDTSITGAEEYQKTTQLSQKRYVGYLMIFSGVIYLTAAFVGYFYYYPKDFVEVLIRLVPLFLFPLMIYGLKSAGCWWFVLRLEANEQSLERLKRKRREVLETVKDKEVYNVAKEILEKFDPQLQLERLQRERALEEERQKELTLRRRTRRRSLGDDAGDGTSSDKTETGTASTTDATQYHQHPPLPLRLPRPILPRDRSALDKMVDYLLGDGPNNRYALICGTCLAHNGMALRDDFEYVAFRCAYCSAFNPAKKQRLKVPNLHDVNSSSTRRVGESDDLPIDSLKGRGGRSEKLPSSSFFHPTPRPPNRKSPEPLIGDKRNVVEDSAVSQSETFESLNADELEIRPLDDDSSSSS